MAEPHRPEVQDGAGHAAGPPGWFDERRNVRRFLFGFYAVCAGLLVADLLVDRHAEAPLEGRFAFYAVWGFLAIAVLVLVAKGLRRGVMRPEDYYER